MFGQPQFASINRLLNHALQGPGPLIAVHRGTGAGNVVENTSRAVSAALRQGADMVEIDIVQSTDGEFFLFHDGYEPMHLGTPRHSIKEMSGTQIRNLKYIWHSEAGAPARVQELGPLLHQFKGTTLFNVDRSWWYWPRLLRYLDQFDMAGQLILKCPVAPEMLDTLRQHPVKYPFAPMVHSMADIDRVAGDPAINLVGLELLADSPQHELAQPGTIGALHERGLFCLLNAIVLNDGVDRYAGWDDHVSLFANPDDGWGILMDRGADIIQTDWPAPLAAYRAARLSAVATPQ